MSGDEIILRNARPTADDGLAYARFLDQAAEGGFRAMLGPRFDRIVGEAFQHPGHDLSHETAVFAERAGRPLGMATGYTAQQHAASSDRPLRDAAGWRMARMVVLSLLGRGLKRFIEAVPDGDFYLMAVAVDDDARGSGIGSLLLDDFEQRARAAGCARFVLDVAEKNEAARRLYERRGMRVEAVSPPILRMPRSRAQRMVKSL